MNVLITGATGNLGSLLAHHLIEQSDLDLVLMQHRSPIPTDLQVNERTTTVSGDLSKPESIGPCLEGVDIIVHFAGVLFKANPERFLPTTNTNYFDNLTNAALDAGIERVILISFPHVEGPTSRMNPASGRLDGTPVSVHAKTRLEEERLLFDRFDKGISLRVGMVYGKGILMIDAAHWFARHRLLGVWNEPTEIHLISKTDFCRAVTSAILNGEAKGIYHIGDEGDDTLQSFLDFACGVWQVRKPWRMPLWMIYYAAWLFENWSGLFNTRSPLTKDFIDIGRVSYYGDTTRFRSELLPELTYRNVEEGAQELLK